MSQFHVTVVGGGVAGILSALYLSKNGAKVCLIDSELEIGGLLKSFRNEHGDCFDYGTHFIPELAQTEINELLSIKAHANWETIESLKVSTYSNGHSYSQSSYIKPQHLTPEERSKAHEEFIACSPRADGYKDLNDYFESRYGPTLSANVFKPLVCKIHGKQTENLSTELARIFQLNRILLFTEEETIKLKQDAWFDDRLAYHSATNSPAPSLNYYPTNEGVGAWISILLDKLQQAGVEICTGARVASIESKSKSINKVCLADGRTIETDHLVWTISPGLLSKTLRIPTKAAPPQFVQSSLTFLTYDEDYLTPSYYLLNHDAQHQSYRVTLFDNFSNGNAGKKRICVESFQPDEQPPPTPLLINEELIQMGVLPENAIPTYQKTSSVNNGFPIMRKSLISDIISINQAINEQIDNVTLCGKASGKAFFMTDTLAETYKSVLNISF